MSRRRRRPVRRQSYDYDDYNYRSRRRRSGCLAPIQRFFRNIAIVLLTAIGAIVFFLIVLLIAFNFRTFIEILYYALFVAAGLAILGILYLIVRIITAISHRFSAASTARSKAKIEKERIRLEHERVEQARAHVQVERQRAQQARVHVQKESVQVRSQEAKLYRDDYAFYQKHEQTVYPQNPRRTHNFRDDPYSDYAAQGNQNVYESRYRTRNLRESNQEPLVRVLSQLSTPVDPEPEETELEQMGMPAKGQIFRYQDYKHQLKPGQLMVGIRKDGSLRVGSWQDFKIMLILGSSSSGKSTTVLEKCSVHVQNRGQLIICDPGGFKPDSLIQRIGPLENALMPGTILALEHEDIMQNMERFRIELEKRRRGADMTTPILLVIDELNGLLMDKDIKKELTELIEKFAQQARDYNMFMILCAQRASGLAAIRNSVISYVCHKCPEMEASKILPSRYAKLAPELGVGQTFVSDANGFIDSLQQVYITAKDIAASYSGTQHPRTPPHRPQTEPIASRVYGAPSRRLAATPPQQKLVLRRTNLVQDQTSDPAQPLPVQSTAASAIWGEGTQVVNLPAEQSPHPAPGSQRPAGPPDTEELAPKQRPSLPPSETQPHQDTFEMLALRRTKKKK